MKRMFGVVFLSVIICSTAFAQENLNSIVELLRQDVKTKKIALITEIMQFTEEESAAFWPIFRKYDVELQKVGDERVALIKDYAENFDNIDDDKAKEIAEKAFKIDERRLKLQKKYFKEVSKKTSSRIAAKFIQIERQINNMIDLQISSELPLIQ
jgi:hypothetical protein